MRHLLKNDFLSTIVAIKKPCLCMDRTIYKDGKTDALSSKKEKLHFLALIIPNSGFGYTFRDQKYYVAKQYSSRVTRYTPPAGIPVQAVADGYILIKQYPNTNSPGIVIVKHANGYMSLYIGIIPNNKPMFSRVSLWDSIGMTRDYTEHNNQNNIHIELYKIEKLLIY